MLTWDQKKFYLLIPNVFLWARWKKNTHNYVSLLISSKIHQRLLSSIQSKTPLKEKTAPRLSVQRPVGDMRPHFPLFRKRHLLPFILLLYDKPSSTDQDNPQPWIKITNLPGRFCLIIISLLPHWVFLMKLHTCSLPITWYPQEVNKVSAGKYFLKCKMIYELGCHICKSVSRFDSQHRKEFTMLDRIKFIFIQYLQ